MEISIIYQDKNILVIDKPAGLEVFTGPKKEISLYDLLVNEKLINKDCGPVHRIDADTSGIVLVAKNKQTYDSLKKLFENHQITKEYTTLVCGDAKDRGEIKTFIFRDPKRKQAMKAVQYPTAGMRGNPREALTFFNKTADYKFQNNNLSLLKVNIATGRTHQIRVHMQFIGTPIIGDQMYNTKTSKQISNKLGLNRQFLHASKLEFVHPNTGKDVEFKSPPPNDLVKILTQLQS